MPAALGRLGAALTGFLRGFLGLPGSPGAPPRAAADPEAARRALAEGAARRDRCC
jgi:hypothetical protein